MIFGHIAKKSSVRLEFDGDFIESIRYFDSGSQRSFEKKLREVTLAGAFENQTEDFSSDIFGYLTNPIFIASAYELDNIKSTKRKKLSLLLKMKLNQRKKKKFLIKMNFPNLVIPNLIRNLRT